MTAGPFHRLLERRLRHLASQFPAVTMTGPRQSGKSTLCRMTFPSHAYVNLEAPDVRRLAVEDPRSFLARHPNGVILDEIQRVPELTSYLQPLIDVDPTPGRWILTGSQHGLPTGVVSQSLAGRNALVELLPLEQSELTAFPFVGRSVWDRVLHGGFPAIAIRGVDPGEWCRQYVATYLERDIREIRAISDFDAFRTFLRLTIGRTAQPLNLATLGGDVGVSAPTVRSWMSVLEATYTIHRVPPIHATIRKRLTKSPRIHVVDTGLACALLGITNSDMLALHPLRGSIFESFVVSEFRKRIAALDPTSTLSHYRDRHGDEADLIVERQHETLVIEIKSGATIASDWGRTTGRIADRLAEAGLPTPRPIVIHGGDTDATVRGVSLVPWTAIGRLVAGSNDQERP